MKIYRNLHLYWIFAAITFVLSMFSGIAALSIPLSIVSLVLSIAQLYQLYAMREVSLQMNRACRVTMISLLVMVASLLFSLVTAIIGSVLSVLFLLIMLAGMIAAVVAEYYFYTALDELAAQRGYDYPLGRIKLCFWAGLVCAVVSSLLQEVGAVGIGSLVTAIGNVVILALLWQYLAAVRQKEEEMPE